MIDIFSYSGGFEVEITWKISLFYFRFKVAFDEPSDLYFHYRQHRAWVKAAYFDPEYDESIPF